MIGFGKRILAGLLLWLGVVGSAQAEDFEFRTGVDVFWRKQTSISSLHYLTMMKDIGGGLHIGQSVYSAATGDGGGLFIGGAEVFQRFDLGESTSLDIGAFVGGGGGASVVIGDGLMTKGYVTLNQNFGAGWAMSLGAGWTRVTGSAINTPHVSVGVSRNLDLALGTGHGGNASASGVIIGSVGGIGRYYYPISSSRRGGLGAITPMGLVGAEFTFRNAENERSEIFLSAVGAAAGDGAGYAEWLIGPRFYTRRFGPIGMRAFADVGLGFSGGGRVDTGGGFIGAASAGLDVPLFAGIHAQAGALGIASLGGDFQAVGGFLRTVLRFDDPAAARFGVDGSTARHWRLSSGLTYQFAHPGFRPPGHRFTGNSPLLVESSLDLMFGEHFYVHGTAATVVAGKSGGFAMGTVGIGWEQALGAGWAVSGELFAGAAAGGGINTAGGIIGGAKVEIDYALNDNLRLSAGVGRWYSMGGSRPWTLHAGVKIPFTSFHSR